MDWEKTVTIIAGLLYIILEAPRILEWRWVMNLTQRSPASLIQNKWVSRCLKYRWVFGVVFVIAGLIWLLKTDNRIKTPSNSLPAISNAPSAVIAEDKYANVLGEQTKTFFIAATNPAWQPTYKLSSNQWAWVTINGPTNGTWITDSGKGGVNAEGYSNTVAGSDFMLPKARQGSLLFQTGNGGAWPCTNINQRILIHPNSTISFTANDDLANDAENYGDNRGYIGVTITVFTNSAEALTNQ